MKCLHHNKIGKIKNSLIHHIICCVFRRRSEIIPVKEEQNEEVPSKDQINYINSFQNVKPANLDTELIPQEEIIYDQKGFNVPGSNSRYFSEGYPATDTFSDSKDSYAVKKGYQNRLIGNEDDVNENINPQIYSDGYKTLPYRKEASGAEMVDPYYYGYESYGQPRSFRKFHKKPVRHVYRTYPKQKRTYGQVYNPISGYDSGSMKYY